MLGTLIGDIVGSAYEFSHFKGKDFAPLFHPKARFTDDTVCTVAVADALIRGTDPQATLIEWCKRYAENGGWGKQFALWFLDDHPQPYGSWGNGAAMRIAPVGLLASTEAEVLGWSDTVSAITHNHSDAMKTARAVALAIFWARQKTSAQDIGRRLTERYGYPLHLTPDDIRPTYKRTEKAIDSVPQAISCALHSTSFEDAVRNAISLGGDSDTIAAIAGGIAEALHGIPNDIAAQAWAYLPKDIQAVMNALYQENEHQPMTTLPPELLQAFAETHYIVHHEPPFTLHIGHPCPDLKALMAERNALCAAYITAWNPFSRQLNDPENKARQEELKATLKKLGLICIDGIGQHPSNNWPGEVSVLVLGLDMEAAKSLALHYDQHAFVWAAGDGTPELVQP